MAGERVAPRAEAIELARMLNNIRHHGLKKAVEEALTPIIRAVGVRRDANGLWYPKDDVVDPDIDLVLPQ